MIVDVLVSLLFSLSLSAGGHPTRRGRGCPRNDGIDSNNLNNGNNRYNTNNTNTTYNNTEIMISVLDRDSIVWLADSSSSRLLS